MAQRIKILPEQLTNKIAAGEVVERPASVVKELVENALDAGSTDVIVEIEAGGKRLLRVTDNGCGMSREDALLALERHATSKIVADDDLFNLSTLGFRGEALPSIASVSRFTLASREAAALEGTEIYVEGGRVREVKACGMAAGTVVTIRNLFFNTPARLKFMKSTETETGHVGDVLTKLALSRPEVRFTYLNEGKTVFQALPGDLSSRVASVLGNRLASELHPLTVTDGQLRLHGLLGGPATSRSAATALHTFINGRYIRDRVVQHAILQGYRQVLERGRYPVVVLFIQLPPAEVDVNVHPTKHEVRFREQGLVHGSIQGAVETFLRGAPWLKITPFMPASPAAVSRTESVRESLLRYATAPSQPSLAHLHRGPAEAPRPVAPLPAAATEPVATPDRVHPAEPSASTGGYFTDLTIIGQFNAAYILCQAGTDLVIIDQHAAHERVAYERLRQEFDAGGVEGQGLLFPESLELTHGEAAVVREHGVALASLGFDLEHFGGTTWLLKGVPRLLAAASPVATFRDLLEEFQGLGKSRQVAELVEEMLATVACHSVVRGRHSLSTTEIRELFGQMDRTDFAGHCPHGRPVVRTITLAELEKMFKRT
ncbi:MAG TPA: DNA mismatch repair endonuclease MutL [Geobacteraceae bacterium]